jgi:hypothetical protein
MSDYSATLLIKSDEEKVIALADDIANIRISGSLSFIEAVRLAKKHLEEASLILGLAYEGFVIEKIIPISDSYYTDPYIVDNNSKIEDILFLI